MICSFSSFLFNFLNGFPDYLTPLRLSHVRSDIFKHLLTDIFNTNKKSCFQAWIGKFFIAIFSPKTIFEVIMFYRTMRLNGAISTVMICNEQSLVRNEFSG